AAPNSAANASARPWSRLTAATSVAAGSLTIPGAIVDRTMLPSPTTAQPSVGVVCTVIDYSPRNADALPHRIACFSSSVRTSRELIQLADSGRNIGAG